jgi:hypothetical protein
MGSLLSLPDLYDGNLSELKRLSINLFLFGQRSPNGPPVPADGLSQKSPEFYVVHGIP